MPSLIINGTFASYELHAGDEDYQLWGYEGNDTLSGGSGNDVFVGGKTQGSDTFLNASSADIVNLNDTTLSDIVATNVRDGALEISFNRGNRLTVQSTEALSANFVFADGTTRRYNHATKFWQGA